jgi:hypothetical protein
MHGMSDSKRKAREEALSQTPARPVMVSPEKQTE